MKVFVVLFFCIVAVFGIEESNEFEKKIAKLSQDATNVCAVEMKLTPPGTEVDGNMLKKLSLDELACFLACVDQKMGSLTEDGTYRLEKILSFTDSAEEKERIRRTYSSRIEECPSIVGKDTCKLTACVHGLPKSVYMKTKNDD